MRDLKVATIATILTTVAGRRDYGSAPKHSFAATSTALGKSGPLALAAGGTFNLV
jgi:hypothetical protein